MPRFILLVTISLAMAIHATPVSAQHRSLRQEIGSLNHDLDGLTEVQELAIAKIQVLEQQQRAMESVMSQRTKRIADLENALASQSKLLSELTQYLSEHRQFADTGPNYRHLYSESEIEINERFENLQDAFDWADQRVAMQKARQRSSAFSRPKYLSYAEPVDRPTSGNERFGQSYNRTAPHKRKQSGSADPVYHVHKHIHHHYYHHQ